MDTPEQPIIWPPAPTLAPPKAQAPPRLVPWLPKWVTDALTRTAWLGVVEIVVDTGLSWWEGRSLPRWIDYGIILAGTLAVNLVIYWRDQWREARRSSRLRQRE